MFENIYNHRRLSPRNGKDKEEEKQKPILLPKQD